MKNIYSDIISVTTGKCKGSSLKVTYKNKYWGSLHLFITVTGIPTTIYIRIRELGYSREESLLFLLNELPKYNKNLADEIEYKLRTVKTVYA